MPRRYINQLANGETLDEVFLVADKQLRANRAGNLYLQVDLRDKTGVISSRMWNATENLYRTFDVQDYLLCRGKVQVFQGALQLILSQITKVDPSRVNVAEFLPHTEQDRDRLLARVREILLSMHNPHLRALVESFLMDDAFVRKFTAAPAGVRNHHAYLGGLLEHVTTLLEAAGRILDLYPQIDRELLLCGIFLHDLGKIDELSYEKAFGYSDEGQLIGHLVIGVELLDAKIRQAEKLTTEAFPQELVLRLKHMILSHHGSHEFGSPRLPMTPEAIALHHLDNFDAKVHAFCREIRDDPNRQSSWTAYNAALGRKLFKGAAQGDLAPSVDLFPADGDD